MVDDSNGRDVFISKNDSSLLLYKGANLQSFEVLE
jgi:hypothetical protein